MQVYIPVLEWDNIELINDPIDSVDFWLFNEMESDFFRWLVGVAELFIEHWLEAYGSKFVSKSMLLKDSSSLSLHDNRHLSSFPAADEAETAKRPSSSRTMLLLPMSARECSFELSVKTFSFFSGELPYTAPVLCIFLLSIVMVPAMIGLLDKLRGWGVSSVLLSSIDDADNLRLKSLFFNDFLLRRMSLCSRDLLVNIFLRLSVGWLTITQMHSRDALIIVWLGSLSKCMHTSRISMTLCRTTVSKMGVDRTIGNKTRNRPRVPIIVVGENVLMNISANFENINIVCFFYNFNKKNCIY